jgi:hydrogenase maturation protease
MRTLVLGLGNPIVRDDALGLVVAEQVAQQVDVDLHSGAIAGLALLDCVAGYDSVIMVDASNAGLDAPGTVRRTDLSVPTTGPAPRSRHDWTIPDVLVFGKQAGLALPSKIVVYTMEAGDMSDFGEGLSPQIEAAIPGMVRRILCEQFSTPLGEPMVQ